MEYATHYEGTTKVMYYGLMVRPYSLLEIEEHVNKYRKRQKKMGIHCKLQLILYDRWQGIQESPIYDIDSHISLSRVRSHILKFWIRHFPLFNGEIISD
jgi:hypothetical protein